MRLCPPFPGSVVSKLIDISDIRVILKDLSIRVKGFVCLGSDYNPVIVLNSRMSVEQQRETYLHEIRHILNGDMGNPEYHEYGEAI